MSVAEVKVTRHATVVLGCRSTGYDVGTIRLDLGGTHASTPTETMASNDSQNEPEPDAGPRELPTNIVARSADDGRVIIYDEERHTAWISSTYALSLQNIS